ncbi:MULTISPECIES: hypothetical protein [unclassified Pseudoalteromonas]|uniref:hypothetical protein n=1 Tax=unclassified Pseudoalteromonas TaxID=194690 RepID=UPI000976D634|nr:MULTISPECIES: hypothetical protein [unclassified Pseudoalteromonas]MDN3490722.1 hypothetical protein [Pseudoalteromonas sp. APC 3694]
MKPLLSCLLFCFTLFYSASSVAYNEAMCILIKQEMQQYSDNKTSRKYRNAARDYKKNCSNPARTQPATKPKPQPIIEQPIPEITKPQVTEPVLSVVNAPIAQSQTQSSLAQQSAKSNVEQTVATTSEQDIEQSIKHTQSTTVPASAITATNKSQSNITTNDQPSIDTTTQNNTTPAVTKSTVEPLKTAMPVTVNATEQVNSIASLIPKKSNMLSLVLPSVALLLVVIIGVVVLMRLRHVKQNNEPADTSMPLAAPPTKCDDKQSSTAIDESKTLDTSKSEPNANEVSTAKVKQIPNTAEFEAAAKATLERIKNATEHAEPQVRDFDPEAKPIKKQRKPVNQPSEPVPATKKEAPIAAEPISPQQPKADLHSPKQPRSPLTPSTEHDFKEPEIRTFDPNAPLPTKKSAIKPEQVKVSPVEPTKPDIPPQSSNPFANLSLDESWDPNSPQKPKVEEKQRAPKSQALIEAEERAKNMQTKE